MSGFKQFMGGYVAFNCQKTVEHRRVVEHTIMWKNLAPDLVRQRVIIEGTTEKIVEPDQIKAYLIELAKITDMEVLSEPKAYSAHDMGYGGWIHWKSSGAAFYSYPTNPPPFYG